MRISRRGSHKSDNPSPRNLLTRPAPEPATFDRARIVGNYLVQDWTTPYGTIGCALPLKSASPSVLSLSEAVYSQSWEYMHEWAVRSPPRSACGLRVSNQMPAEQ